MKTKAKTAQNTNVIPIKPRNLAHIKRDRGYRFHDRDPILDKLCRIITDSNLPSYIIAEKVKKTFHVGMMNTTIDRWLNGITKKPLNETMDRVAFVLGYERGDWKRNT